MCRQRIDLFVAGRLLLEIKSVERIHPVHIAQVVSWAGKSDITSLTAKPLRLAIELSHGSLYSFRAAP